MVIPNSSPLKILEKMERGRIQGLSKLGGSEQKPMNNFGNSSRGRIVREPENFQGTHV